MATIYRLGSTLLTFAQREYLYAAVGAGYTRNQIRGGFRTIFGKGFSNATFTQARKAFAAGRLQAERANLANEERKRSESPLNIPIPERDYRRYNIQGTVYLENLEGDRKVFDINFFQSNNSLDAMNDRVAEIIDTANNQSGSDWTILEIHYSQVRGVASETYKHWEI